MSETDQQDEGPDLLREFEKTTTAATQRANYRINELVDRIGQLNRQINDLDKRLTVAERNGRLGRAAHWVLFLLIIL